MAYAAEERLVSDLFIDLFEKGSLMNEQKGVVPGTGVPPPRPSVTRRCTYLALLVLALWLIYDKCDNVHGGLGGWWDGMRDWGWDGWYEKGMRWGRGKGEGYASYGSG